jgi:hypothetical protein
VFGTAKTSVQLLHLLFSFVILTAAIIIYLATDSSLAAIILPCLHGGWNLFRTGIWLLKSDPFKSRARICFAFYVGAACWNSAAVAFITIFIFVFAAVKFGFQPNITEIEATMLVLTGGVVLNTLIGLGAVYAALHYKIKVWVRPRLRIQLEGDLNSLAAISTFRYEFNYAIFVVATSLVFPSIILGLIVLGLVGSVIQVIGLKPNDTLILIIELVLFFVPPFAMIPCYAWLSSRIVARNPQECWPD